MKEFEWIRSRQNPKIAEAVRLKDRKYRKETGLFFFEGKKLFAEAVARNVPLQTVFLRQDAALPEELSAALPPECAVFTVTESVYEKISEEKSPEGVFCIAKTIDKYHKFATIYNSCDFSSARNDTILMAVSVRDPGNLGTILRSAAAFGAAGVVLSSDCADLYAPKTVRASMGTLFDLPVTVTPDPAATVAALRKDGVHVYAAALDRDAVTPAGLPVNEPCCLLVGNEGHGLPSDLIAACTGKVFIPMCDKAESLNVSAAAAVLLYSRFSAEHAPANDK